MQKHYLLFQISYFPFSLTLVGFTILLEHTRWWETMVARCNLGHVFLQLLLTEKNKSGKVKTVEKCFFFPSFPEGDGRWVEIVLVPSVVEEWKKLRSKKKTNSNSHFYWVLEIKAAFFKNVLSCFSHYNEVPLKCCLGFFPLQSAKVLMIRLVSQWLLLKSSSQFITVKWRNLQTK